MIPVRGRGPEATHMKTMDLTLIINHNQVQAWTAVFASYL